MNVVNNIERIKGGVMKVKMNDVYGTEINIAESRSGYFRIDFEGEQFVEKDDGLGNNIPCGISLNVDKARVLQACLNEYLEES